jgi:DNA polymerase-3 subunit gamma/tau
LEKNYLHHAYLFTGTRGVGKTTVARILAKSLNCERGVTAYPCGECIACREIEEGRFVDLIEVDAASRTRVEDTRDLLENVQYAPTRGRYKVYLVDEVHMLSTHSFNALLKTLEEPPPHVKFVLATTDPQKIPPTILSRCLQFNLKHLSAEPIARHLAKLLESEGITYEPQALQLLAQAADGSVRDALSLLDQAIAYGAGVLLTTDVGHMLGTLNQSAVFDLLEALATNDAPGVLQRVAQLAEHNPDFLLVLSDILSILQRIALAQVVPATVDATQPEGRSILQLAQQLSPEDVQLFYQIGLIGRRDLPLAPEPRGGFEMVMLRMLTFRPETVLEPRESLQRSQATVTATIPIPSATPAMPVTTSADLHVPTTLSTDEWAAVLRSLKLDGAVKQLALNCALKRHEGDTWHLVLPHKLKTFLNKKREEELENKLQEHYGESQRVHICVEYPSIDTPAVQQQRIQETRQQAAAIAVNADPFVTYLKENCDAQIKKITVVSHEY